MQKVIAVAAKKASVLFIFSDSIAMSSEDQILQQLR